MSAFVPYPSELKNHSFSIIHDTCDSNGRGSFDLYCQFIPDLIVVKGMYIGAGSADGTIYVVHASLPFAKGNTDAIAFFNETGTGAPRYYYNTGKNPISGTVQYTLREWTAANDGTLANAVKFQLEFNFYQFNA